jgi:hypothetical protein
MCWRSIAPIAPAEDLKASVIQLMLKVLLAQFRQEVRQRFRRHNPEQPRQMRAVSVARRSAVKAKTQAINQLRALLVCAPQDIRERLWKGKPSECVNGCARLRSLGTTPLLQTLAATLRMLAKRWLMLAEELKELDAMLERLTRQHAKRLRGQFEPALLSRTSECL